MTELRVCVVDGWRRFESIEFGGSEVCHECEVRMAGQLDALAAAVPLLAVVAGAEPTRRGALNLDAVDLALPGNVLMPSGELRNWVVNDRTDQVGYPPPAGWLAFWAERWSDRDVWSADAAGLARLVKSRLHWACREYRGIAEFSFELRVYYTAVRRALGRSLEPLRYGALCPGCHERTLCRPSGADWVECRHCGRIYEESMLPELARASLYWEMPPWEPLTAMEAAMVHGISAALIRQWASRGRLAADIGPWGGVRYLRIEVDRALALAMDGERQRAIWEARRAERVRKRAEREASRKARLEARAA